MPTVHEPELHGLGPLRRPIEDIKQEAALGLDALEVVEDRDNLLDDRLDGSRSRFSSTILMSW